MPRFFGLVTRNNKRRFKSLCVLGFTGWLCHVMDVYTALFDNPILWSSFSFKLAFLSTTGFLGVFLYNLYLSLFTNARVKFEKDKWQNDPYSKKQVQYASMFLVSSGLFWNIALWHVWFIWTPFVISSIFFFVVSFINLY